jgi:hypothetical protein
MVKGYFRSGRLKKYVLVPFVLTVILLFTLLGYFYYVISTNKKDITEFEKSTKEAVDRGIAKAREKTNNWQQYKNDDLGVSFKYPKYWGNVKIEKFSDNLTPSQKKILQGDLIYITFSGTNKYTVTAETNDFGYAVGVPKDSIETLRNDFGKDFGDQLVDRDNDVEILKYRLVNYTENWASYFQGALNYNSDYEFSRRFIKKIDQNKYRSLFIYSEIERSKDRIKVGEVTKIGFDKYFDNLMNQYSNEDFILFVKSIETY